MYGTWLKASRFINYQKLLEVSLNQLKYFAYHLDEEFTSRQTEREFKVTGERNYKLKVKNTDEVIGALKAMAFYTNKRVYGTTADSGEITITLAACAPGLTVIAIGDHIIVDDGNGSLVGVDKIKKYVGSIDYKTGIVKITDEKLNKLPYVASYGSTTTASMAEYTPKTGAVKNVKYYKVEGVCIPYGGSYYAMSVYADTTGLITVGICDAPVEVNAG